MKAIYAVAVGGFGAECLRRLRELVPDTDGIEVGSYTDIHPAKLPVASVYIVLSWRPAPKLCRALDDLFHDWRVPWLPVIQEHPYLRVGPVVVPGQEGCFHCYEQRLAQHSPNAALMAALHEHYDAHPVAGPAGYLPAVAGIAAALAAPLATSVLDQPESVAGIIRQFHIMTREMVSGRVIGIHGCPRCGLLRDERTRAYHRLQQDYKSIFEQTGCAEVAE